MEAILSSMAGKMSYVNGQFTLFAGASQTPSLTITDDELLAPISISTNASTGDLYNSVKPIYVDRSLDYQSTDAEVYQDSTFLNADTPSGESTANYVKQMETQLPFTVTDTMAQRLGRIALKSQRQTTTLSVLVSLQFMRCQPNDWVYLTNERLGYTQKTFEVLSTNMEAMQDGEVPIIATRLELKEVEASVFNFATNDYTTGQAEGSDVSTGDYSVTAPTNLSLSQQNAIDGTTSKVDILVNWTNNASDKVVLTEIAYKLNADSNYTADFTAGKGVTKASIPNVVVGSTYNVKLRHIDLNGVASAYTSAVNITIAAASSAPSAPSNLSASTSKTNILVSWTNPNNSDLRAVKVYRRTANTTPTDDTHLVDTLYGEPNAITTTIFGDQDGLTAGTTYYFWVRAINHSGQHSGFVGSVNGTFTAAVIGDGTITELKLADDAVTNAKIAVDAIQGDVIAAGAIVEGKLGTDSISAAKIQADAVTSAKILANNIIASKIATDAIIARHIQADQVTAGKINADAVTAREINVSTLSAISANVGTLTAGTIDASTLTINNIVATNISTGVLNANRINLNGSTLGVTSNGLNIASGGVSVSEIGTRAVGSMVVNGAAGSSSFGDGRVSDNFNSLIQATFTTAEGGDYQIVANCMVGGTINNLTQVESRIRIGSTVIADYNSPVGGNMLQPIILAGKITLAANTSYTAIMEGQVIQDNAGVTPAIAGFSTRISALKLNKQ